MYTKDLPVRATSKRLAHAVKAIARELKSNYWPFYFVVVNMCILVCLYSSGEFDDPVLGNIPCNSNECEAELVVSVWLLNSSLPNILSAVEEGSPFLIESRFL